MYIYIYIHMAASDPLTAKTSSPRKVPRILFWPTKAIGFIYRYTHIYVHIHRILDPTHERTLSFCVVSQRSRSWRNWRLQEHGRGCWNWNSRFGLCPCWERRWQSGPAVGRNRLTWFGPGSFWKMRIWNWLNWELRTMARFWPLGFVLIRESLSKKNSWLRRSARVDLLGSSKPSVFVSLFPFLFLSFFLFAFLLLFWENLWVFFESVICIF